MKNSKYDKTQAAHTPVSRRGFLGASTAAVALQPTLSQAADQPTLLSYTERLSYAADDLLRLHISSSSKQVDVDVIRVGAERQTVWTRKNVAALFYPTPKDASAHGCRWPVALELEIPREWRSGYYEIETTAEAGVSSRAYFILRSSEPGHDSRILMQLTTNTDNAYNNFGGQSIYSFNSVDGKQGRRVSFQRPMPASTIRAWEVPFIRWAEANGYQLDYAANNDLEVRPEILKHYRLVLSVGHDEYWSTPMRDNLEAFIAEGGNVAFFSGNVCCWQIRNEKDGAEMVCYKEAIQDDPIYNPDGPNPTLSTLWSHHLLKRPENQLTGVGVVHGGFHRSHGQYMDGSGAYTVHRPDHWVFAGTKLTAGQEFGGQHTILGYECDGCEFELQDGLPVPTGRDGTPTDFEILATGPAKWGPEETLSWYDRWPTDQSGAGCLGLYTKPDGGTVFTAATTDWPHGLDGPADPIVDRITRNVLDRLLV